MNNPTEHKVSNNENAPEIKVNTLSLAIQIKPFRKDEENSLSLELKLGKPEEEILAYLFGKLTIPTKPLTDLPTNIKRSSKQMKKSISLFSKFTGINGHTDFSHFTEQRRQNETPVGGKSDNLLGANKPESEKDVRTFRQKMNAEIESNGQKLSVIRHKIKNENKQSNADISTTIFELELANGYMKLKLDKYQKHGKMIGKFSKRNLIRI